MVSYFTKLENSFSKYRNLIGLGVIIIILLGVGMIIVSPNQVKEIASECGFDDGKMKCVCTEEAWNIYQEGLKIIESNGEKVGIFTQGLNIS